MLQIVGINHHKTPLNIRERISFNAQQLPSALNTLLAQPMIHEAMILSTCNRTEIYTNIAPTCIIYDWLLREKSIHTIDLNSFSYTLKSKEAVTHLMSVASGLDSMIIGEPQILGQLKTAYFTAEKQDAVGDYFKQLFPSIFASSKTVRSQTNIGANPVTLAFTITQLAKTLFNSFENRSILYVGAGETIELIAKHFHGQQMKQAKIANRTIEKSRLLASEIQAEAIPMREIPEALKTMDIVITATASQLPILGKGMIESAMHTREKKPLLLVDLAVPRDIEPEVETIPNVRLYNIDTLQTIIAANKDNRQAAAEDAKKIITEQVELFEKKMRVFQMRHVITQYRDRLEKIQNETYEKALKQLKRGVDPEIVLKAFGAQLISKILHHPTVKIREAAEANQCTALQQIKAFFEAE